MATKLRKIRYDRVDLVDRGANPQAHVMIVKRDLPIWALPLTTLPALVTKARALATALGKDYGGELVSFDDERMRQALHQGVHDIGSLWWTFCDVAHRIINDAVGAERTDALQESSMQFAAAVETAVDQFIASLGSDDADVKKQRVRFTDAGIQKRAQADRTSLAEAAGRRAGETTMNETDIQKRIDDTVTERLAKAKLETDAAIAKAREEGKTEAAGEIKKAQDRADEADKIAKAERDARVTRELTEIAKGMGGLPTLDAAADKDLALFKRLHDGAATAADWTRVRELLEKAAEALRTSAGMAEVGKGGSGGALPAGASAEAEVFAEADRLVKADATGKLTREAAVSQIATSADAAHVSLMKRYNAERR
jgi:hypothetical protein